MIKCSVLYHVSLYLWLLAELSKHVHKCIVAACDALINAEDFLNELDRTAGDADCGTTHSRGAHGRYTTTHKTLKKINKLQPLRIFLSLPQISQSIHSLFFSSFLTAYLEKWAVLLEQ
jgi:dihydroxyacetone kinase